MRIHKFVRLILIILFAVGLMIISSYSTWYNEYLSYSLLMLLTVYVFNPSIENKVTQNELDMFKKNVVMIFESIVLNDNDLIVDDEIRKLRMSYWVKTMLTLIFPAIIFILINLLNPNDDFFYLYGVSLILMTYLFLENEKIRDFNDMSYFKFGRTSRLKDKYSVKILKNKQLFNSLIKDSQSQVFKYQEFIIPEKEKIFNNYLDKLVQEGIINKLDDKRYKFNGIVRNELSSFLAVLINNKILKRDITRGKNKKCINQLFDLQTITTATNKDYLDYLEPNSFKSFLDEEKDFVDNTLIEFNTVLLKYRQCFHSLKIT